MYNKNYYVNKVKLRATQVNGAHLKPLDRGDVKPKIGVQWNPMTNSTRSHRSIAPTTSGKMQRDKEDEPPNPGEDVKRKFPGTSEDFLKLWGTIADYSERFLYVWNLR